MWIKYYRAGHKSDWAAVPVDRYTKEERESGAAVPFSFGDGPYDIFDLYGEHTDDANDARYEEWCEVVRLEIAPAFEFAEFGQKIVRKIAGHVWHFEHVDGSEF